MNTRFESSAFSITLLSGIVSLMLFPLNALSESYALSPDGNAAIQLMPFTSVSRNDFDTSLLTSQYNGWMVNKAEEGEVTLDTYDAMWNSTIIGGGTIELAYTQSAPVPGGNTLNWIQVIDTNIPLGGATPPYIDPVPNDDDLPFYWTASEQMDNSTSQMVSFSDFSRRDASSLATTSPITWSAKLFPVEYDGARTVVIHDGISWGWTMSVVPEPKSYALMLSGLLIVTWLSRRKIVDPNIASSRV